MSIWLWEGRKAGYGRRWGCWAGGRTASSRRGMAEDELIRITLFGDRCPFKTADLALSLRVSSKFQAKKANTIFCLRITWKLNRQDWWAFSNGSRQIGRCCSSFCQIQNIPERLHFCLVYFTLNLFQINWNWQLHTCTVHLRPTGVLAN